MSAIVSNSDEIIQSTREGRLYIRTQDFFRQQKVREIILDLLESDIVKDIEEYQKKREKEKKNNPLDALEPAIASACADNEFSNY